MKKNSLLIFILSFLFLFSTSLWAEEDGTSSEESSTEESSSYDASNASEFEDDED